MIRLRGGSRSFQLGEQQVMGLDGLDLDIAAGDYMAVMGPSGSGKSTLMNILGALDRPTAGTYLLAGEDVSAKDRDGLADIRGRTLGFVFQSFNLLARTSALENVELPLLYANVGARERHRRAREALERVGLGDRLDHHPSQLSGGQQQRVAIARALVGSPKLILADEPTGNLDSVMTREIMDLLERINGSGTTIVMVTHSPECAERAHRQLHVFDGRVVDLERPRVTLARESGAGIAASLS